MQRKSFEENQVALQPRGPVLGITPLSKRNPRVMGGATITTIGSSLGIHATLTQLHDTYQQMIKVEIL